MAKRRVRRKRPNNRVYYYDYTLVAVLLFLIGFGLIMLYSSSSYEALHKFGDSMYFLKRQALFSVAGLFVMVFVSQVSYYVYAKFSGYLFGIALFLMALVEFTPLGVDINGAKRWLRMPGFTLQPSEVMKLAIVLFIPLVICKLGKRVHSAKGTGLVLGVGFVAMMAVYKWTDNLSTGIIVFAISFVILYVAHRNKKLFEYGTVGVIGIAVLGAWILGKVMEDSTSFRLRRVLVWLQPEKYASTGAYQTLQGLYAIGSGGLFGKGLGNSVQKTMVPEAQNDMVLTIVCEELGLFGALMLLLLFGLLLYRLFFIAQNAPTMYGALVVTGIMAHIAVQVILNIAVVTNMIPNTGITLPFVSYGGTSVVFLLMEMGCALGISRSIRLDD